MISFDEVEAVLLEIDKITLAAATQDAKNIKREKVGLTDVVERDIATFKRTGVLKFSGGNSNEEVTESKRGRGRTKQKTNPTTRSSSLKENELEQSQQGRPVGRPRKNAFVDASQITEQPNMSLNKEAGRPDDDAVFTSMKNDVVVKMERLSQYLINKHAQEGTNVADALNIKKEFTEMPPPSKPPIKQSRKRKAHRNTKNSEDSTNSDIESVHVKQELIVATKSDSSTPSISRDSDIQIRSDKIDTIVLVDSDEDAAAEHSSKTKTRTKTKKKLQKHSSISDDESEAENKKPKNDVFETARSTRTKTRNQNKIATSEIAQSTRPTRTKTRNATRNNEEENDQEYTQKRRLGSSSTEDEAKNAEKPLPKRTKTKQTVDEHQYDNNTSLYEDAVSDIEGSKKRNEAQKLDNVVQVKPHIMNETVVIAKPTIMNETVIIEKPTNAVLMNETIVKSKAPNQLVNSDLLTDDEDIVVSPVIAKKTRKIKQVFSPYGNSPVKKRVEAFEKLGAEVNSDMPPRMTRTKTKAKEQDENMNNNANEKASAIVAKLAKQGAIPKAVGTPIADHRLLHYPGTADKYKSKGFGRNLSTNNSIPVPVKSKSALKASQAEFRERELKRQQKEAEALSKKEALIQAQIEEKRRKREERQLKAQQTRDTKEKDKQKLLESEERAKQEKWRQMMAEKEEKMLKQREEAARKRALAFKKAAEEKQKEERKKEEINSAKKPERHNLPLYLRYDAPFLPTQDCYDSDDSNASKPLILPLWQKRGPLLNQLKCTRYISVIQKSVFRNRAKTVDLLEIFPSIEPHKLKRTSSAIWNRSGLTTLASIPDEDEETV